MHTNFVFQNTTKIYFGENQLENLPSEIQKCGSRVLITYGGGSVKRSGLLDKAKTLLENAGITVFEFGGIEPNPRHTSVNAGAKICKENKIDAVLAIGGGSVIDCTKAIAAAAFYDGDAWDLVTHKVPVTKALPIFTILTLSATGSEMDCGAVISNLDTNDKLGLVDSHLQPTTSFLDPTLTYTVSKFQTAAGSADIIAHVLDCYYFSRGHKLEMIDQIMEVVLKTVVKYAPIAIKDPSNYEARSNLMWAASWALNDFLTVGVSQAPTCHCIEHELSAYYDITHGLGLAILMPHWLEYVLDDSTAADIKKFGVNVFNVDASLSEMEGAKQAIEKFKEFLYNDLGLDSTLSALKIDKTNFEIMAKKACFGNVMHGYRDLKPEDVVKIFEMCL